MARRDCALGVGERDGAIVFVRACACEGGGDDELLLPSRAAAVAAAGASIALPGGLRIPCLFGGSAWLVTVS